MINTAKTRRMKRGAIAFVQLNRMDMFKPDFRDAFDEFEKSMTNDDAIRILKEANVETLNQIPGFGEFCYTQEETAKFLGVYDYTLKRYMDVNYYMYRGQYKKVLMREIREKFDNIESHFGCYMDGDGCKKVMLSATALGSNRVRVLSALAVVRLVMSIVSKPLSEVDSVDRVREQIGKMFVESDYYKDAVAKVIEKEKAAKAAKRKSAREDSSAPAITECEAATEPAIVECESVSDDNTVVKEDKKFLTIGEDEFMETIISAAKLAAELAAEKSVSNAINSFTQVIRDMRRTSEPVNA